MQALSVTTTENWSACLGHYRRRGDALLTSAAARRRTSTHYDTNGTTWATTYTYDGDNRPTATTLSNGKTVTNTYDALGRITRKRIGLSSNYDTTLTYLETTNGSQTALLASYQNGSDTAYTYTYDENGNIISISQGGSTTYYTYDRLNELIREDNATLNQSWTYTYDVNGNLLNKKRYAYVPNGGTLGACLETISYGYDAAHQDWADQLTSYNGEAIRYDDSGNPISYRGYTMAWQGKRLTSANKSGTAITYSYDENGIRTQKSVNGVATNYYYNGSLLISMTQGTDTLLFSYDANGIVVSVNFNGTDYYYVRNGQGDVIKLIDGNGTTVTEYTYDTWGKLVSCTGSLSATLGTLNPFRYRGYVYDNETGFYYLQSRYYDPEVCRFLSADVLLSTGQGVLGHNTFAYCLNNPVNMSDPSGCVSKKDRLLTESDKLYGGKTTSSIRDDLRKAEDLNTNTAPNWSYNCYGNAIKKQIVTDPSGYRMGDSVEKTFAAVQRDLGGASNCRRVASIDSAVPDGWYMVAMMCADTDYHFIRLDEIGWFNKSGYDSHVGGCYLPEELVRNNKWLPAGVIDGVQYLFTGENTPVYYNENGPLIFIVREGWDD